MPRTVSVVAHTHWDREWYLPFESFRSRLAGVLDDVIDTLERDDRWTGFHLDGQVAAADDYLEVRPGASERLRRLVENGRLSVGPWYVLMDEFCVSGETIIRSLEMGIEGARRLGRVANVGYLPDMFGHVAQMPQILRLAGLQDAVVWRGVPAHVRKTAFVWAAPDGSEVRAEYLPVGYASGALLPSEPAALLRRIEALEAECAEFMDPDTPLLLMNGTDHQTIQTHLPDTASEANASQDRYMIRITTLESHIGAGARDGLPRHAGGAGAARGPDPDGRPVEQGRSEGRRGGGRKGPREVRGTAGGVVAPARTLALRRPGARLDRGGAQLGPRLHLWMFCGRGEPRRAAPLRRRTNDRRRDHRKRPRHRVGGFRCQRPCSAEPFGTAAVRPRRTDGSRDRPARGYAAGVRAPGGREERSGTGQDLGRLLGELARDGWLPSGETPSSARLEVPEGGPTTLSLASDTTHPGEPAVAATIAEAWAQAGARRNEPLVVRVDRSASQTVLAHVEGVPGYGWSAWQPAATSVAPVSASPAGLSNSLITVGVDIATGTFSLDGLGGFGRLVDGGDAGDTYNYCPPDRDEVVDAPSDVWVTLLEDGPLRGKIRVDSTYDWPADLSGGTRSGSERIHAVTQIELRAGERFVRVSTSFVNRCRDHRLRILLPLPVQAPTTTAECAFSVVERGEPEGGPREAALATFPSRGFVVAGGLTVAHDGLLEHELVDEGNALAITVLRATGVLSKPVLPTRPNTAGPAIALEGTQMQGPITARYAITTADVDPWELAETAWVPLVVVAASGTGHLPPSGSRLDVSGAEVSALRRRDERIEIRLFNPSDQPTVVRIPEHCGTLVDLRGQTIAEWDAQFELGPWKIANARLHAVSLD